MGIGSTMKNMFRDERGLIHDEDGNIISSENVAPNEYDSGLTNDPSQLSTSTSTRAHKLPPGTGPGTTGKPTSEKVMEHDLERAKEQGIAGHGTDAAAAAGGSISDTHQARGAATEKVGRSKRRESVAEHQASARNVHKNAPVSQVRSTNIGGASTQSGAAQDVHAAGHGKVNTGDAMPNGKAEEDTNQLNPITHETVRHIETEEVERVKDLDRHVHHIQHHVQPIIASEELKEQIREQVYPVTQVHETHANKTEDNNLFEGQVNQFRNTLQHANKERSIVDKGTVVNENIHHHIHHVIQPIIEKETVDRQRVHTTIPIHEVTHEAPIVHQSQTHAAVPLEHFIQRGGTLSGSVTQDSISGRVLQSGHCTREVEGIAEDLSRELGLSEQTAGTSGNRTSGERVSDNITARTGQPDSATHTHAPSHAIRDTVDMKTAHRPVNVAASSADAIAHPIPVSTT